MDSPCDGHLIATKKILRYVKGTHCSMVYYINPKYSFSLSGFTDVDWGGDVITRRSTSGYCFNLGSAAIFWCSKKQQIISLSSTKDEYVAASMATQECTWLKRLIQDIGITVDYPVPISCDNENTIKLAGNPMFHARTKHIEVHYYFVREKVLSQKVVLQQVGTNDPVANVFTKALPRAKFEMFRRALGLTDRVSALRGSVAN